MHLLFGGIKDRIEKRHTETGAGNDAKSRGVYAVAVTAAKRTSPPRKLRQEAEIGSTVLCVSGNVCSDRAVLLLTKRHINYCEDFYELFGQKSGCKWGNVNDHVHGGNSLTHHQARPDGHHHFKPRWKLRHNFRNESGDGVPVVRFMEFCLIKAVNQYDVVFFR